MKKIAIKKIKYLLSLSSLLLLVSCGDSSVETTNTAETKQPAEKKVELTEEAQLVASLRDKAMQSQLAYDILESLTTEVGARMAGTPQDALAVEWAVNKLKSLDFDKVWTEPVTFDTWKREEEKAKLTAPYEHEIKITALGFSVATPKEGIEAEVIRFDSLEDLIASPEDSAKGKIVYINKKMKKFRNGAGYGEVVAGRSQGAAEAAKKGAVAIVIRSVGTDSHRLPHTGMMRYKKDIKKIPAAAMSNPDADLMERIFSRNKPVTMKLFISASNGEKYTSQNVIAEMTGRELPDEKIIIGGHLDSWDLGTGAVDDGAGVAITMAAAKIIGDSKKRPRRTIRLVLFANEEQGLVGAFAYAKQNKDDIAQHITGAESDFGAGKIYEFASNVADDNMVVVEKMKKLMKPLGIEYAGNDAGPGPDLIPLYRNGMSVFSLRQDGTDYFDLHHTADDTLDKVTPENLSQNTAAYVVFAYLAANSQQKISKSKK